MVGLLINELRMAMKTIYEEALRPLGRTIPQVGVMAAIERSPGVSIAQLAQAKLVTPQSMAEHVAALEAGGFVTRKRTTGRGHVLELYLTDAGKGALDQCYAAMAAAEARLWKDIRPEDRLRFRELLERHLAPLTISEGERR